MLTVLLLEYHIRRVRDGKGLLLLVCFSQVSATNRKKGLDTMNGRVVFLHSSKVHEAKLRPLIIDLWKDQCAKMFKTTLELLLEKIRSTNLDKFPLQCLRHGGTKRSSHLLLPPC